MRACGQRERDFCKVPVSAQREAAAAPLSASRRPDARGQSEPSSAKSSSSCAKSCCPTSVATKSGRTRYRPWLNGAKASPEVVRRGLAHLGGEASSSIQRRSCPCSARRASKTPADANASHGTMQGEVCRRRCRSDTPPPSARGTQPLRAVAKSARSAGMATSAACTNTQLCRGTTYAVEVAQPGARTVSSPSPRSVPSMPTRVALDWVSFADTACAPRGALQAALAALALVSVP